MPKYNEVCIYIALASALSAALVSSVSAVDSLNVPDEYHLAVCTVAAKSPAGANLTYVLSTVNGPAILREFIPGYAPTGATVPCVVSWWGLAGAYDPPYYIAVLGRIYVTVPHRALYYILAAGLSLVGFLAGLLHWVLLAQRERALQT